MTSGIADLKIFDRGAGDKANNLKVFQGDNGTEGIAENIKKGGGNKKAVNLNPDRNSKLKRQKGGTNETYNFLFFASCGNVGSFS